MKRLVLFILFIFFVFVVQSQTSYNKKSLEQTVKELLNLSGNMKAEAFNDMASYIEREKGKEGLKAVENKLAELGVNVSLKGLDSDEWVNIGVVNLVIIVAKELFEWNDEDIFKWGEERVKIPFIIKTFLHTFISLNRIVEKIPEYWKMNFDFGSIEVELREEEKKVFVQIYNFKVHPLYRVSIAGHIKGIVEFAVGADVFIKEKGISKCNSRHEFVAWW